MIFPDPNERQIDDDAAHEIMMAEAERIANGERIVLARLVRRVITAYLTITEGKADTELRWTDTDGFLRNRDGLPICGHQATDGARCIREAGEHNSQAHFYRERAIKR